MSNPPPWLQTLGRSWFALAMTVLVIIAIPGLILFGLNVFGYESNVNGWLQDRLHLTYHIPFAWWLSVILLFVPILLILLYFLKLKRKPLSVPSTFLWKKSIEDLHVNALFQWLRQNILLLLQLLALMMMIYAIMDFRVYGRTAEGKHYILMIDNSASMSATDVEPNRLEWAKQEALKEIDAATDIDFGMVIVFNSTAEIRQSYTNNRGALRSAVQDIQTTQRPTRIEEALTLAAGLANPTRTADDSSVAPADAEPGKERTYVAPEGVTTEVHLYSDGRFADLPEFTLGNLNLSYHTAGKLGPENVRNVGIINFNATRDEEDPTKLRIFASIRNYGPEAVQTRVECEVRLNGQFKAVVDLLKDPKNPKSNWLDLKPRAVTREKEAGKEDMRVIDLPGEVTATYLLSDIDEQTEVTLHARLKGASDRASAPSNAWQRDDFPLDDEAWTVLTPVRKARVLLVTPGNYILEAFFSDDTTQQLANIVKLPPESLTQDRYLQPARNGEFDVVIFDRCGPESEEYMPRANTLFIGYPPPPWKMSSVKKVNNPAIKGWSRNQHPVMRYLADLGQLGIDEAFELPNLPPRTPRLIECGGNLGILIALSRQSFMDLVMTFPILDDKDKWNTNWPILASFPLFFRNVLFVLGNLSEGTSEESVQPGQVKTLRPDAAVTTIQVSPPGGKPQTLNRGTRADFSFGDTQQVGVYDVAWKGTRQRSFAVNLLDSDESNLEPRGELAIGDQRIGVGSRERKQPRELWKWLVLAALGLLLAEWYIYNRRVYV